MEQKQKLTKQSTVVDYPFKETIEKLLYSKNEEDREIGLIVLANKYNLSIKDRMDRILFFIRVKKVVVLKDTSNNQKEFVIGRYGLTIRDITSIQAMGTQTMWI